MQNGVVRAVILQAAVYEITGESDFERPGRSQFRHVNRQDVVLRPPWNSVGKVAACVHEVDLVHGVDDGDAVEWRSILQTETEVVAPSNG